MVNNTKAANHREQGRPTVTGGGREAAGRPPGGSRRRHRSPARSGSGRPDAAFRATPRRARFRALCGWLGACLLAPLVAGSAHAQAPQLFFSPVGPSETVVPRPLLPAGEAVEGDTVRRRTTYIDPELLAEQIVGALGPGSVPREAAATFALNLFDDAVYEVVGVRRAPTASGGHALSGRLRGVPFGEVTLVVNGEVVAGTVATPTATYTIHSASDGAIEIRETDPAALRRLPTRSRSQRRSPRFPSARPGPRPPPLAQHRRSSTCW